MSFEAEVGVLDQPQNIDGLIKTQRQFQTPDIARAIARKHGLDAAIAERPFEQHPVTGDFYRFVDCDDRLVVLLGDAPGHGIDAAPTVNGIHASLTPDTVRAIVSSSVHQDGSIDIAKSLQALDEHLYEHHPSFAVEFHAGIPMVMVEIDKRQNVLRVANAGMEKAILLQNNHTAELITPGVPLGLERDIRAQISNPEDEVQKIIPFERGDMLILMTDGVAADKGGLDQSQGQKIRSRIPDIETFLQTKEVSACSAQELVDRISGLILEPDDDITVVAVQL